MTPTQPPARAAFRDEARQFPPLSALRIEGHRLVDPALLDRPIGAPVNPWPRLHAAMRDWRGLVVVGLTVFAFAIWS